MDLRNLSEERNAGSHCHYFSHFGAVVAPEEPLPELVALRDQFWQWFNVQHGRMRDWERDEDDPPPKRPDISHFEETEGPPRAGLGLLFQLGQQDSLEVFALVIYRQALLCVQCELGGWAEYEVVRWPLLFTAPAAVAGACCNPRYGMIANT